LLWITGSTVEPVLFVTPAGRAGFYLGESNMAIRKNRLESMSISDPDLPNRLALADLIAAENPAEGRKWVLWKRPIAEDEARRGPPYSIEVVTIQVSSAKELKQARKLVNKLKGDDPNA
jgi:hypothetical protein